ncbi:PhnD/SsuA/transferrin family substrate-binding protein [Thiorhodococcus mannitoliphagus]|uniref:PhnD/SsuA/transferrin family substrate-binding protein n=1 Tax=Thiorhodococcus mannitoliphagus TaxID=329406 RepID=A0A6P1DYK8_9GAMM|nr:PhnD/SsuA/transferrin family substrate-binding protein [Thiorhodococcus mannitoliphagus]NEX22173.1 PhnD/SsuA/transferrin family substrate-binding protein [Thiorhodococcus mannitoliphagus]
MLTRRDLLRAIGLLGISPSGWCEPIATGAAQDPSAGERPALRFGLTPVILDDRVAFLRLWASWLERQLARPVVFIQRARYREIMDLLLRGGLDLAWICGYPYVQHRRELSLIAVPRFQGQPKYRSYVIVGADSSFTALRDLQGRLFAWSDPDSNSGYLYPRFALLEQGLDPDRFFRRTFFTWGHRHAVEAVAEGLADGAAVDSYVWETLARRVPALTERTRIILRSPLFGFPPLAGAPGLAEPDLKAIRQVLLRQDQDPIGRQLLDELNLDGFAPARPALFDDIAAMAARLDAGRRT